MINSSVGKIKHHSLSQNSKNICNGLSTKDVQKKLLQYGKNELVKKRKISPIKIFLNQFSDFMVIILMLATLFSLCMNEIVEALTIIFVIILNAALGFWQEFKTEKTLDALKSMAAPVATVIRDGVRKTIPADELVPGDLVLVEAGNRIPADGIILESKGLTIDESMLTGESLPVEKIASEESTYEMPTMGKSMHNVFMGTTVTSGKGQAIVVCTGMNTEMGKIADMIQNVEEDLTPLQKRLDKMGTTLVYGCLIICAIVSLMGVLQGESIFNMILSGISLAVAAIPEGLPAVVTISLAIGVQRMLKKNALVRRLPAVETLGCATVICSDKTGTLTENKMMVKKVYAGTEYYEVTGSGFNPTGDFMQKGKAVNLKDNRILTDCLIAGALCNNSILVKSKADDNIPNIDEYLWSINGDPTEGAILAAAAKANITNSWLNDLYTRVHEIPFDSERKMMSVVCRTNKDKYLCYTKGAPDILINLCSHFQTNEGIQLLDEKVKNQILQAASDMASQALRVIAIARKPITEMQTASDNKQPSMNTLKEQGLNFLGLVGMIDPPKTEAIFSVKVCKQAGIKVIMITGDHKQTAAAVAKELGIFGSGDAALTGEDLDKMNDREFDNAIASTSVYARVSPRHKLKIVKSLKKHSQIVAMTGDGVNDSPAVKEADIGVAMGITGTDVTKESSSMILLDDNFSTIVSAVEEGRGIYDNIRKFIRYMLACNIGEVLTMFLGSFLNAPVILIPIQILWVNLVTDGLPGIALGLDPNEKDIMMRKPRPTDDNIFSEGLLGKIIKRGILIGLSTLAVFCIEYYLLNAGIGAARTAAFATLILSQLIHVFECRSEKKDIFEINILENKYLVWSVLISLIMMLGVIYIPGLQFIFKTTFLVFSDWMFILGFSLIGPALSSVSSLIKRRFYVS
jgi:Ca2+-transporting ATPase